MLSVATQRYQSDLLNIDLEIYQEDDGVFWFHGATLCDVFEIANPSQAIQRHVDDDWRKKFPAVHGKDSWYVMEPGFYQLLHASKHPAAKRFQRWVYSEVLPKLRADGGYIMPNATSDQVRALMAKHNYLVANQKKRWWYTVFREIAEYNAKLIGDGKNSTRENFYWQCFEAWKARNPERIREALTLEQAEAIVPKTLKLPWKD
jgi:prophage antirepressor-like protein